MSNQEKRYRFQIQFDTYAETDKKAVSIVKDMMSNMMETDNPMIIWMAENYFASLEHREIDYGSLESQLFDEEQLRLRDIKEKLPF